MKKLIFCCILLGLSGCGFLRHEASQTDASRNIVAIDSYSGPKAKIVLNDFDIKAAKANSQISSSLRQIMLQALKKSNRFIIIDRQAFANAMQQQEKAADQEQKELKENKELPDLIIAVAITDFEPNISGGRAGVGAGGGVGSGILGGLLGSGVNKAHLGMEIKIVNTQNSEIIASTKVQGQASDTSGLLQNGFGEDFKLGPGISMYVNTPMEKAIRICIIEVIRFLSQAIPQGYYKY